MPASDYGSPEIEMVAIAFALISGINYATHYWLCRLQPAPYRRDPELPYFLGVLALSPGLIAPTCHWTSSPTS
jgi:trk system potassium uptake protein TrkH